jgi:uncharacterized membrane protein
MSPDPGRAARHEPRPHRRRHRLGGLAALAGPLLAIAALLPAPTSAAGIIVTTPFPLVAVEPGASVTFPLTVTSPSTEVVTLSVVGLPASWAARFSGGGFTVDGVQAAPGKPASVDLNVNVPADASGTVAMVVRARGTSSSAELPLSVRVNTNAGGSVTLDAAYPTLRGPSSATFPFQVTLHNDTPRQTTFALGGQGPDGWTVNVQPAGSSQATSLTVAAGSTGSISVSVTPAAQTAAGEYPIVVAADGGGTPAQVKLTVVVTGTYSMTLTTPDQVLSTDATAGQARDFQLVVHNAGSGALTNTQLTATPPSGWTVTFNPAAIPTIDAGKDATVTATITPASNAVAGDYNVAFAATAAEATSSATVRVTVNTSLTWAVVGVALIVLVFIGLGWVFARYGRR